VVPFGCFDTGLERSHQVDDVGRRPRRRLFLDDVVSGIPGLDARPELLGVDVVSALQVGALVVDRSISSRATKSVTSPARVEVGRSSFSSSSSK